MSARTPTTAPSSVIDQQRRPALYLPCEAPLRGAVFRKTPLVRAQKIWLCHEPTNPHDADAVRALTEHGTVVGYLPRAVAQMVVADHGPGAVLAARVASVRDEPRLVRVVILGRASTPPPPTHEDQAGNATDVRASTASIQASTASILPPHDEATDTSSADASSSDTDSASSLPATSLPSTSDPVASKTIVRARSGRCLGTLVARDGDSVVVTQAGTTHRYPAALVNFEVA